MVWCLVSCGRGARGGVDVEDVEVPQAAPRRPAAVPPAPRVGQGPWFCVCVCVRACVRARMPSRDGRTVHALRFVDAAPRRP